MQWLHTFEMRYIRRRMRISWTEKNKNEEVIEMTEYKRFLLKTIRKKTTSIFRHINRADGLEKQILSGEEAVKDSAQKYTDSLNNFVTRKESRSNELIMITDDREDYEAMIADVCNRPGT